MRLEPVKLAKGFHLSMEKNRRYCRIKQLNSNGYRYSAQGMAEMLSVFLLWAEGEIDDAVAERFLGIGPGTMQKTYDEIFARVNRTFKEKVLNEQE